MGDTVKRLPGCTCHLEAGDCTIHDDRPLTAYELDALEALDTGPRFLTCCLPYPSWIAGWRPRSTFELHQVEVTDLGVVRWWRCRSCGALRPLDGVARPIELIPGATA